MSWVQSTLLTFMYSKDFIRIYIFPLVAGGFLSAFSSLKLMSPHRTLTGKGKSRSPAARINNRKEYLPGKSGNMITLWIPLSFLTGYMTCRWQSLTGNMYCHILTLKFEAISILSYISKGWEHIENTTSNSKDEYKLSVWPNCLEIELTLAHFSATFVRK